MTAQFFSVQSTTPECTTRDDINNMLVLATRGGLNLSGHAFRAGDDITLILHNVTAPASARDLPRQILINTATGLKQGDMVYVDGKLCEVTVHDSSRALEALEEIDYGRLKVINNAPTLTEFRQAAFSLENTCQQHTDSSTHLPDQVINDIMSRHGLTVEDVLNQI